MASSSSSSSETYNGRVAERYSWSQQIGDLEVTIPVPKTLLKGKQVAVTIGKDSLSVKTKAAEGQEEVVLVEGVFSFPVKKEDCMWNLLPGDCLKVWLQKDKERWWVTLLEGEEPLDLQKDIEAVRDLHDLDEEEQMKIQELCWNEERKKKGLPTSQEMTMQNTLRQAWNAEGSPFKGTPFDPSMVQMMTGQQGNFIPPPD